jgi:hypothetical protein
MVWDMVRDFISHFVWLWVRIPRMAGGPQVERFYCETRFIAKAICLPDLYRGGKGELLGCVLIFGVS